MDPPTWGATGATGALVAGGLDATRLGAFPGWDLDAVAEPATPGREAACNETAARGRLTAETRTPAKDPLAEARDRPGTATQCSHRLGRRSITDAAPAWAKRMGKGLRPLGIKGKFMTWLEWEALGGRQLLAKRLIAWNKGSI